MKPIKPGQPCFLRGTFQHDGKVVIPDVHVGMTRFTLKVAGMEMQDKVEDAWHLTSTVIAVDGRLTAVVPTRCLVPLENPPDGETDEISKVRKYDCA